MRILLILIFTFFLVRAYGGEPRITTSFIHIPPHTTLEEVLIKKMEIPADVLYKEQYLTKNKRWNDFVMNFVPKDAVKNVYLELPYRFKSAIEKYNQGLSKVEIHYNEPKIITAFVRLEDKESLEQYLKDKIGVTDEDLYINKYLEKNIYWNGFTKNFVDPNADKRTYIELPYKYYDGLKANPGKRLLASAAPASPVEQVVVKAQVTTKIVNPVTLSSKTKKNISAFYSVSQGDFTQNTNNNSITATSTQNSPITLGLSAAKQIKGGYYNGSLYFSQLNGALPSGDEKVDIPLEYGFNVYRRLLTYGTNSLYAGIDYESFSTFDLSAIEANTGIEVVNQQTSYVTVGYNKLLEIFKQKALFKASLSQTITNNNSYKGNKFILFGAITTPYKFSIHSFFKMHLFSGPDELQITRYGAGIAFNIF